MSIINKKPIQNLNLTIDNETITDDTVIYNHFNKFFNSGKLVKKYQTQLKPFIHNWTNNLKNPSSFHLYHQRMLKH